MERRVGLTTIGVEDPETAAKSNEQLGWQRSDSSDGVIVFDLIGQTLGLYPLSTLADEIGVDKAELGQGAMTLSKAFGTGADILKFASDVFWAGHHDFLHIPDGTIWEVAFNPFLALGPKREFRWKEF